MFRILITTLLISSVYCSQGDCYDVNVCFSYCAQTHPNTDSVECNDGNCVCYPGTTTKRTTPTAPTTTNTTTPASSSQNTVMTSTSASQKPPPTRSPMCDYFNATLRRCTDSSVCDRSLVYDVICPDPALVIYCPHTCGCC